MGSEHVDPHDEMPADDSTVVLDGGTDELSPLQLWDHIMRQHGVAQQCERAINAVDAKEDPSAKDRLLRARSFAAAAAV